MIGKLNTRIKITKRAEVGDFSDPFKKSTVDYDCILETWAEADYTGTTEKFNGRAVGKSTGDTMFKIRDPRFEIEKDHYVEAKGYKYQVEGTMPGDNKLRFIILDCSFVGKCDDGG